VGHRKWHKLGLDAILAQAGLDESAQLLTQVMTLNRLIFPSSEHAMPDWIRRTALEDILKTDFSRLDDNALYRHLDRLYPHRGFIEQHLAQRERRLLTWTTPCASTTSPPPTSKATASPIPRPRSGYSRDKRPDCKQVLVGLVIGRNGFPKAHEVFDGNVVTENPSLSEKLPYVRKLG
jgi:transposase